MYITYWLFESTFVSHLKYIILYKFYSLSIVINKSRNDMGVPNHPLFQGQRGVSYLTALRIGCGKPNPIYTYLIPPTGLLTVSLMIPF